MTIFKLNDEVTIKDAYFNGPLRRVVRDCTKGKTYKLTTTCPCCDELAFIDDAGDVCDAGHNNLELVNTIKVGSVVVIAPTDWAGRTVTRDCTEGKLYTIDSIEDGKGEFAQGQLVANFIDDAGDEVQARLTDLKFVR